MNNKHKLIKSLRKMTTNEMVFKLAEHKQASKDLKERTDLLQEQILINLGCVKVKDDKKTLYQTISKVVQLEGR